MVYRDPDSGKFMSGSGGFDDVEVVTFWSTFGVEAANMTGATGFVGENFTVAGEPLIDYDEVVDRNESLHLLSAEHAARAYSNSTQTADGWVRAYAEVSSSPVIDLNLAAIVNPGDLQGNADAGMTGEVSTSDSIDTVGRPLVATAGSAFSDGTTGVGGGGSAGTDELTIENLPEDMARFHPRDELFANVSLEAWNIADAGIHAELYGQHIYGVTED